MIVIDATNIGGGGGLTHLRELLKAVPSHCTVKVIAQRKVLHLLSPRPGLTLTGHALLEGNLLQRVIYQRFLMDREIPSGALLFAVSGDFLGNHRPVVSMSQNMLLYERDFWREMPTVKERMRFRINYLKQKRSFRNSQGIIFLSDYARSYISGVLDLAGKVLTVIPHGISPRFFREPTEQKPLGEYSNDRPFRFAYVSTVHVYKNQWHVAEAVGILRRKGCPVALDLVGDTLYKPSGDRLKEAILKADPNGEFIRVQGDAPYDSIETVYERADAVVFASSCENMPIILLEAMASGKPLACSDKQPMPEFLGDNGFYFDARDPVSIARALELLLLSPADRYRRASGAYHEALRYSWQETGEKTFGFLNGILTGYSAKTKQQA